MGFLSLGSSTGRSLARILFRRLPGDDLPDFVIEGFDEVGAARLTSSYAIAERLGFIELARPVPDLKAAYLLRKLEAADDSTLGINQELLEAPADVVEVDH
jgi:hypothetical protein